jgi:hypothetical protein
LSDAQPGQDCFENRGGGLHRDDAPVMTVYDGLDGVHVETNWFRDERLVPQCYDTINGGETGRNCVIWRNRLGSGYVETACAKHFAVIQWIITVTKNAFCKISSLNYAIAIASVIVRHGYIASAAVFSRPLTASPFWSRGKRTEHISTAAQREPS